MNWTFHVLADYCIAVPKYWWLLAPGIVMPVLDISKAHVREFRVPRWLTLAISLAALVTTQFMAYKDSTKYLSNVIVEKRPSDSSRLASQRRDCVRVPGMDAALGAGSLDLKSKPTRVVVKSAANQPEPKRCWFWRITLIADSTINGEQSQTTAAIVHCNVKVDAPFQVAFEFDRDFIPGSMVVPGSGGFMGSVVKNGRTFIQSAGYPLLSNQLAIVTVHGETGQYPRAVQTSVETLK